MSMRLWPNLLHLLLPSWTVHIPVVHYLSIEPWRKSIPAVEGADALTPLLGIFSASWSSSFLYYSLPPSLPFRLFAFATLEVRHSQSRHDSLCPALYTTLSEEGDHSSGNTKLGQGRLIQLTWKKQTGFLYDPVSLQLIDSFSYSTTTSEGWGVTFQAERRKFSCQWRVAVFAHVVGGYE
jgi:hypothetical protein